MPRPVITERKCCCARALPMAPGEVPVMKAGLPDPCVLAPGACAPIDSVLESGGNGAVVFRRDDEHAVGARQLVLESHHFRRQVAFNVLVEHRQIVDAGECGFEFDGAEPDQPERACG